MERLATSKKGTIDSVYILAKKIDAGFKVINCYLQGKLGNWPVRWTFLALVNVV